MAIAMEDGGTQQEAGAVDLKRWCAELSGAENKTQAEGYVERIAAQWQHQAPSLGVGVAVGLLRKVLDASSRWHVSLSCLNPIYDNPPTGLVTDTFLTLYGATTTPLTPTMPLAVPLLVQFVEGDSLPRLLAEIAVGVKFGAKSLNAPAQQALSALISLPDRVASALHGVPPTPLTSPAYPTKLTDSICAAGEKKAGEGLMLVCGHMIGRLFLAGHGGVVGRLLRERAGRGDPSVGFLSASIQRASDQAIETIIDCLLKTYTEDGFTSLHTDSRALDPLIGGCLATSTRARHTLTHTCLLMKVYSMAAAVAIMRLVSLHLPNQIGDVLLAVAAVWGDVNALRHTDYRQHRYVTAVLMAGLGVLTPQQKVSMGPRLLAAMMEGIQSHMDCPLESHRRLGQVAAECVASVVGGPGLCFDMRDDDTTTLMRMLAGTIPAVPLEPEASPQPPGSQTTTSDQAPLSDSSDDDLQPYAMPRETRQEDSTTVRPRAPAYLRECLRILRSPADQSDLDVITLQTLPDLVKRLRGRQVVGEVAVDLLSALILREDPPHCENAHQLRLDAMLALCIECPHPCAPFLSRQFYAPNYTIVQRMNMLDLLGAAAQALASEGGSNEGPRLKIEELGPKAPQKAPLKAINTVEVESDEEDDMSLVGAGQRAREIVAQRVEKKTRRRTLPNKASSHVNRLGPVAGDFFYGLVEGMESKEAENVLSMSEGAVLAHLIHTLGLVASAAALTPSGPTLCTHLLSLLLSLRFHPSAAVRRAVLFALAKTACAMPPDAMRMAVGGDLKELVTWLRDTVSEDADAPTRELAMTVLVLLDGVITSF